MDGLPDRRHQHSLIPNRKHRGPPSTKRQHHILRCLKRHKADIVGLQETHFKDEATVHNQRWWLQ